MPPRINSKAKKHHVGGNEWLTTREIAKVIGGTQHNVRARLAKGWKGEALVLPVGERRAPGRPRVMTQVVAYKLALKFKRRTPTVPEIMEVHPMAEETATYWRNAIIKALEDLA